LKFAGDESGWQLSGSLDPSASSTTATLGTSDREESALNMFKQMDLKGKSRDDTQLKTIHQNTINTVRGHSGQAGNVQQISTSGVDGRVVIWNL